MRRAYAVRLFGVFLLASLTFSAPLSAQEFRIETDVFVDDQKEPVQETLTIFFDGIVYDFLLTGVEEITVFDSQRNRLVLMDERRQVKTELAMSAILSYTAQMETRLGEPDKQYLLGKEVRTNVEDGGWLTMANDQVTYRAEGIEPKDPHVAAQYQQFADWYARLNAMRMGNLPPFMRIQLNAELASKNQIPKTIERTLVQKKGLKKVKQTLCSRHLANWRLSTTDRKMIDRATSNMAAYRTVSFQEYLQVPEVAAK